MWVRRVCLILCKAHALMLTHKVKVVAQWCSPYLRCIRSEVKSLAFSGNAWKSWRAENKTFPIYCRSGALYGSTGEHTNESRNWSGEKEGGAWPGRVFLIRFWGGVVGRMREWKLQHSKRALSWAKDWDQLQWPPLATRGWHEAKNAP